MSEVREGAQIQKEANRQDGKVEVKPNSRQSIIVNSLLVEVGHQELKGYEQKPASAEHDHMSFLEAPVVPSDFDESKEAKGY
jgi:hypothetical protein